MLGCLHWIVCWYFQPEDAACQVDSEQYQQVLPEFVPKELLLALLLLPVVLLLLCCPVPVS